jgi:hypothetical protein
MFFHSCCFIPLNMPTSDGAVLFNTTTDGGFNGLVFENQYVELSTQLPPNPQIYGLGEHVRFCWLMIVEFFLVFIDRTFDGVFLCLPDLQFFALCVLNGFRAL